MQQLELEFISKKKSYHGGSKSDISITVACKNTPTEQTSLVFRNGSAELITNNTYWYVMAISGTRLYFKYSSPAEGYKITKSNNSKNCYATTGNEKILNWARLHEGDYSLQFDKTNNLYFIEDQREWITKGGSNGK